MACRGHDSYDRWSEQTRHACWHAPQHCAGLLFPRTCLGRRPSHGQTATPPWRVPHSWTPPGYPPRSTRPARPPHRCPLRTLLGRSPRGRAGRPLVAAVSLGTTHNSQKPTGRRSMHEPRKQGSSLYVDVGQTLHTNPTAAATTIDGAHTWQHVSSMRARAPWTRRPQEGGRTQPITHQLSVQLTSSISVGDNAASRVATVLRRPGTPTRAASTRLVSLAATRTVDAAAPPAGPPSPFMGRPP
jgi:hypothetical protein